MLDLLFRTRRPFPTRSALALAAVAGWSGFAYSALSSGQHVAALTVERDAAVANYQQLQEAAGNLKEVEAKLGSARIEHSQVVQGWADTRGKLGAAQKELTVLTKRLDQGKDRVSQTGGIRAEPPTPPTRKP
jgi:hypothetical protein